MAAKQNFVFPVQLRNRILFTLGILAIYRLGVSVPTPGVDANAVMEFFNQASGSLFGLFNTFTGGALERFSVFALGIMPYISASIIFQLLQSAVPALEQLKKEGEAGRKKLNQYTRFATVAIAIVQGYAMSSWFMNSSAPGGQALVTTPYFGIVPFEIMTTITLTAGSCFIMWLGEQITEKGIGNGASLIIFAGIAAGIPGGSMQLWEMMGSGEGKLSPLLVLALIIGMIAVIAGIIYVEVAQRRIPIQHSQRGAKNSPMAQQASHLPLKINFANVIPPIFASSLLTFPATITQFIDAPWIQNIQQQLTPTGSIYNVLFTSLIVFFCFFYTEIVFNHNEVADNLKKYGSFIPGIRAGRTTADFLKYVLDRLTVSGAIYLSVVCIIPTLLIDKINLPFYFGGTSLLILVGVALDTTQQIQSHLLTAKYDGMMSNTKSKSRRVRY